MDVCKYVKGGVWWANLGSENSRNNSRGTLKGRHMVLIVSAVSNPNSICTISVLPISSCETAKANDKLQDFYCIPITTKKDCYVCCNQIQTITTDALEGYVGQCTGAKLREVEAELKRYLLMSLENIDVTAYSKETTATAQNPIPNDTRLIYVKPETSTQPQLSSQLSNSLARSLTDNKLSNKTYIKGEAKNQISPKKHRSGKEIRIYDATDDKRHESITAAAESFGVHVTTISKLFKNKDEVVYRGHKLVKMQ